MATADLYLSPFYSPFCKGGGHLFGLDLIYPPLFPPLQKGDKVLGVPFTKGGQGVGRALLKGTRKRRTNRRNMAKPPRAVQRAAAFLLG